MKIIIDAMGGDNAPLAAVKGAILAKEETGCEMILVGIEDEIRRVAKDAGVSLDGIAVKNASEVITMEDDPASAVRDKKDSSIAVGLKMVAQGEGDAFISAGSTGAVLVGATLHVKRIRGIRRAALAPMLPTAKGSTLLIDCGANVECTPEMLLQFAYMGHYYCKTQMGVDSPAIGLLNNGTEKTKGTDLQKQAYALLQQASDSGRLRFVGNVEGRDVPMGAVDVLVTDGFTGNILLKVYEGVGMFFYKELKKSFMGSTKGKLAGMLVKPELRKFKKMMDYGEIGGSPLLGVAKPVIKAHGSCDAYALRSAILQAVQCVRSEVTEHIARDIEFMRIKADGGEE